MEGGVDSQVSGVSTAILQLMAELAKKVTNI